MASASPIRHPLWADLRSREEPASAPELAAAIGVNRGSIAWLLSLWTQAGLLTVIKPGADETRGKFTKRKRFVMANDARVHPAPPSLNAAKEISRKRGGRAAMWRAIRVLKRFDLVQLRLTAEVSEASAKVYVSVLVRAGILRREVRGKAATGQRSIYALAGHFGPLAPVATIRTEDGRRSHIVTDPNTGTTREISSQRADGPLF